MYIGEDGVLQKRPGWHILKTFQVGPDDPTRLPINGIHYIQYAPGNGTLFIHAGTRLYSVLMMTAWRHIQGEDMPYFTEEGDIPTLEDVQLIRDYVSDGIGGVESWQVKNMDINGDGRVTNEDAQILYDFIINLAQTASNGVLDSSYNIVKNQDGTVLELQNARSTAFEHDGNLYILDGKNYLRVVPKFAQVENLLDISTLYDGVIQSDGTLDEE
jgi:hypothetical protein